MKNQLITMLKMQDSMNTKVHPQWIEQDYEWYRAVWIECGELMDHYGYKWWKKQQPDDEQVKLEVIDIWHFGMSALFAGDKAIEQIAGEIENALAGYQRSDAGVREATEALAQDSLATQGFSVALFWQLMEASGLDFDSLYVAYVGKNVLNFFRQDNGYKEGTYTKLWDGREDNEHLVEISAALDSSSEQFRDQLYDALEKRYQSVVEVA